MQKVTTRALHIFWKPQTLLSKSFSSQTNPPEVQHVNRIPRPPAPTYEIFDVPVRYVEAYTNRNVWFDKADGCCFHVGYVDTALRGVNFRTPVQDGVKSKEITVVAIGGFRRTHAVFTRLFKQLHAELNHETGDSPAEGIPQSAKFAERDAAIGLRVRCVALNLPGSDFCVPFSAEDEKFFTDKPYEKASLVCTVLDSIGVTRADLCVAESDACATALEFAAARSDVRGLVLLSPVFDPFCFHKSKSGDASMHRSDANSSELQSSLFLNGFVEFVEKKSSLVRRAVYALLRDTLYREATRRWPTDVRKTSNPDFSMFRSFARLTSTDDVARTAYLRTLLLREASSSLRPILARDGKSIGKPSRTAGRFAMLLAYCENDRFVERSQFELVASTLQDVARYSAERRAHMKQFVRTLKFAQLADLHDPLSHRLLDSTNAVDRLAKGVSELIRFVSKD